MLPPYIIDESAIYTIGPAGNGEKNAVVCRGQELRLNPSPANKLYILAASTGETTTGVFIVGDTPVAVVLTRGPGFSVSGTTANGPDWRKKSRISRGTTPSIPGWSPVT